MNALYQYFSITLLLLIMLPTQSAEPHTEPPLMDEMYIQKLVFNGTPPFSTKNINAIPNTDYSIDSDLFIMLQSTALASIYLNVSYLGKKEYRTRYIMEAYSSIKTICETIKNLITTPLIHHRTVVNAHNILKCAQWAKTIENSNETTLELTFPNGSTVRTHDNIVVKLIKDCMALSPSVDSEHTHSPF